MDVPMKLYERFGVSPLIFTSVGEAKRELLAKMLEREKKKVGGSEPIYAASLLPILPTMPEQQIDELLRSRIYKNEPTAFDPKPKQRRPEMPILRFGQIERVRRKNARYNINGVRKKRRSKYIRTGKISTPVIRISPICFSRIKRWSTVCR